MQRNCAQKASKLPRTKLSTHACWLFTEGAGIRDTDLPHAVSSKAEALTEKALSLK